jgi:uncharacterized protein (DUF362 family)
MHCQQPSRETLGNHHHHHRVTGFVRPAAGRVWGLVIHNRMAIAIASLLWLIYRSGTQPRRLSYPCQQVAAVNVGAFAAGLLPVLWLWRKPRCPVARRIAIRRQFLAAGILFVTALVSIEGYQYAQSLIPPDMSDIPPREVAATEADRTFVGIHRQAPAGSTYTTGEIETMVRQAISLAGGLNSLMVDKNSDGVVKVVIKPNLVQTKWTFPAPTNKQGVVTDPRVCAAVVKVAKEAGAQQVIIAEGTADNDANRNSTWIAFTNAGFDTNSDKKFDYDTSVDLFDLNDSGGRDVKDPNKVTLVSVPNGVIRTQYYVPNILLNCDALISVPTFKNHAQGTVTLSMKNHVGCAPNDIYHYPGLNIMKWSLLHSTTNGFPCTVAPCPSSSDENQIVHRTVVDLNLARPHDFAVIDALIGVTNGPNSDPPTYPSPKMQMIVAGKGGGVAVDTICTLCMRYDPDYVTQLARADSTGALGTKERRYITVLGNHVASVRSWSFPGNYAGSVLVETTSPTIPTNGIDLTEGQDVWGLVPISISGESDNVGVVKAELIVDGNYESTDTAAPFAFSWNSSGVSPGLHNIKVTVYDAAMNEASISRSVMVAAPPVTAAFSAEPTSGLAPLNVQFADSSAGPVTSWTWDFGDGGTSNEQNPVHRYQQQGTYSVSLTVGGEAGQSNTLLQHGYITVGPPHFGDFDVDGDVDQHDTEIFEACSTGPGVVGPPASACTTAQFAAADTDDDEDVDQTDFGVFQRCLSGPDMSPESGCAHQ